MARNITEYDLLISCPSDVQKELQEIKDVVEEFNRTLGAANNSKIQIKHWSVDSYPQSGGAPQELLNKQFVLSCDLAVAVFWTRFGTPTRKYGSGTEEEIEELLKDGKQVFLYFSEREIKMKDVDYEQYNAVQKFKKKYEKKQQGIYSSYSDLDEFRKYFFNHLSLHFIGKISDEDSEKLLLNKGSDLIIEGVNNGQVSNKPFVYRRDYSNMKFIEELKENIHYLYDIIDKTKTLNEKKVEEDKDRALGLIDFKEDIDSVTQENILSFAKNHNISFDRNHFFDLGNLKKQKSIINLTYNNNKYSLSGNDKEIEKYRNIRKLHADIQKYEQWLSYSKEMSNFYFLDLCLSNNGTQFDEDIDVTLYIKNNEICLPEHVPVPGEDIMEEAIEFSKAIFDHDESASINKYGNDNNYYPSNFNLPRNLPFYNEDTTVQAKDYKNNLEDIFSYDLYREDGYIIVKYNQSYAKQNTSTFLPSKFIFKKLPHKITYKISAKHSPDLISGELIL